LVRIGSYKRCRGLYQCSAWVGVKSGINLGFAKTHLRVLILFLRFAAAFGAEIVSNREERRRVLQSDGFLLQLS
jgi:hypothetical protein